MSLCASIEFSTFGNSMTGKVKFLLLTKRRSLWSASPCLPHVCFVLFSGEFPNGEVVSGLVSNQHSMLAQDRIPVRSGRQVQNDRTLSVVILEYLGYLFWVCCVLHTHPLLGFLISQHVVQQVMCSENTIPMLISQKHTLHWIHSCSTLL